METGESEESVPSEYTGPDLEIGFNAQYLLDFLRAITQDQVAFELKDQKSAGELRPAGDGTDGSIPLCRHADEDLTVWQDSWARPMIDKSNEWHRTISADVYDSIVSRCWKG